MNKEEKESVAHLEWLLDNGILSSEDEPYIQTALNLIQKQENLIKELKELKERINKSIEFINNDDTFFEDGETWQNVLYIERILKGE